MEWFDVADIKIANDDGEVIYYGPNWLRCSFGACGILVTAKMRERSNSFCPRCEGNRFIPARFLSNTEKQDILGGRLPLSEWEHEMVFGGALKDIKVEDANFDLALGG